MAVLELLLEVSMATQAAPHPAPHRHSCCTHQMPNMQLREQATQMPAQMLEDRDVDLNSMSTRISCSDLDPAHRFRLWRMITDISMEEWRQV